MEVMMQIKGYCMIVLGLVFMALSAGCISEETKVQALDAISPVVVLKGSTQYCNAFPDRCGNVTIGPEENITVMEPFSISAENLTGPLSPEDRARIVASLSNVSANTTEASDTISEIPTVISDPATVEPTINAHYIDPYLGGE